MRGEAGRLVRFACVGALNTAITLSAYALLVAGGTPAAAASALAFALGAANGYRLNRAWTFRAAPGGAAMAARYVAVQALGAALSAGGVALGTHDLELRRLAAEVVVLPVVTLTTYALSRRVVFGPAMGMA
jgi:putative flippase GtrA